jgi:hypothetical protein
LILHRRGDRVVPLSHGQWLADHIRGSTLSVLPGDDHHLVAGETAPIMRELEAFLRGVDAFPRRKLTSLGTVLAVRGAQIDAEKFARAATHLGGIPVEPSSDAPRAVFPQASSALRCAELSAAGGFWLIESGECHFLEDVLTGPAIDQLRHTAETIGDGEILLGRLTQELLRGGPWDFVLHGGAAAVHHKR